MFSFPNISSVILVQLPLPPFSLNAAISDVLSVSLSSHGSFFLLNNANEIVNTSILVLPIPVEGSLAWTSKSSSRPLAISMAWPLFIPAIESLFANTLPISDFAALLILNLAKSSVDIPTTSVKLPSAGTSVIALANLARVSLFAIGLPKASVVTFPFCTANPKAMPAMSAASISYILPPRFIFAFAPFASWRERNPPVPNMTSTFPLRTAFSCVLLSARRTYSVSSVVGAFPLGPFLGVIGTVISPSVHPLIVSLSPINFTL